MTTKTKSKKRVTLKAYAEKYNPVKNRRGFPMSESYLYRLIKRDMNGDGNTRKLWFTYELEGEKSRIWIVL